MPGLTDEQFNDIFSRYGGYVYTVCKNTIEHRIKKFDFPAEEIKDIMQISFMKLFLQLQKGTDIVSVKSFLARITVLTTLNYLEKYIRENDILLPEPPDDAPECDIDPVELVLEDEDMNELTGLIKSLDGKYSSVILLKHVHGMSLKEIAEISDIPYDTVCSRHVRGKRLLAKKLSEKRRAAKHADKF